MLLWVVSFSTLLQILFCQSLKIRTHKHGPILGLYCSGLPLSACFGSGLHSVMEINAQLDSGRVTDSAIAHNATSLKNSWKKNSHYSLGHCPSLLRRTVQSNPIALNPLDLILLLLSAVLIVDFDRDTRTSWRVFLIWQMGHLHHHSKFKYGSKRWRNRFFLVFLCLLFKYLCIDMKMWAPV